MIQALNAELSTAHPEEGANHRRLDADEVGEGRGAFLVARPDGRPVGCGAVRRLDGSTAELKRRYVDRERRGWGLGRALVAALEAEARRLGAARLVLETGVRQTEALALYAKLGLARVARFGEHTESPLRVCRAKDLAAGEGGS